MTEQTAESVEQVLRDELVRGDAVIAAARPILRHLLASEDSALFSDEMIARVRGMVLDVAQQQLLAQAAAADAQDRSGYVAARHDALAHALLADTAMVAHAHALALEAHLAGQLQTRDGIDPVLTPLVEELASAHAPETAELAIAVLAAQARFQQHCRRMELPVSELPGELFHRALVLLRKQAGAVDDPAAERAEARLRAAYDEAGGRIGLIARLATRLGPEFGRALAVDRAGLAIFATALSVATGQERDLVVISLADVHGAQRERETRAAGLGQQSAIEQLLHFRPGIALPSGFEQLGSDRAGELLAASVPEAGV